ncbi:NnrS family protein [Niveispirillum sp. KHB5.9]|uniref:NnrS family protein n=1 Tax=Niveispirillum sp. KHB5.9 TaxID=3400269 RepID=UPI003A85845C
MTIVRRLGDEGVRLFFPLSALHAALWPLLWTALHGLSLPLAHQMPPGIWHATEMILGTYGAALIGFITTAVPEWSDTPRLRGRGLYILAGCWLIARLVGLLGADALAWLGLIADGAWLVFLPLYLVAVARKRGTEHLFGFLIWLAALATAGIAARMAMALNDPETALMLLRIAGLVFLGLLGLALSRITVPVTNLVLDPSQASSPYRPHPGRRNLAPALIAVILTGELLGLSSGVTGWLFIAAGAAFIDRVGEAFVGREGLRIEILALAGSSLFSGIGLILVGAARLGAPFAEIPGLHLALMGGLGLGVMTVFAIAGLMHTGRTLPFPRGMGSALLLLIVAVLLRVLPDLHITPAPPGPPYAVAALFWSVGFLVWLRLYWPFLSGGAADDAARC